MKNKPTNAYYIEWNKVITKLPCGRKVNIPFYGTVRAYKTNAGRRFALSKPYVLPAGGNLSLSIVRNDLREVVSSL